MNILLDKSSTGRFFSYPDPDSYRDYRDQMLRGDGMDSGGYSLRALRP
ncbi:hypothetical protein [Moheibacter sp.]